MRVGLRATEIMASTIRRSSLSLAYSLKHSHGEPSKPQTESVVMLAEWNTEPKGVSMSTIPPVDSKSWKKLPKFQRRFYEWLVYSHNLPIANEEDNQKGNNRISIATTVIPLSKW